MKIKTFWTVIIKVLGLLLFFDFLEIITQLITSLTYVFVPDMEEDIVWSSIFLSVLVVLFYLFIISLFIFKSSWIVNKLKLDRDLETETINLDLKIASIVVIAVIIIGGIIFINGFSFLCKSLYDYFMQQKINNYNPTISWIIFNSIKSLLGYLMMTNSRIISKYIIEQSQIE
jgi:hypothetical protein